MCFIKSIHNSNENFPQIDFMDNALEAPKDFEEEIPLDHIKLLFPINFDNNI